jgi:hypothetical protein
MHASKTISFLMTPPYSYIHKLTCSRVYICITAKAQVTIGPWIDNGFYYDFDMQGQAFEDKDLKAIKKEMIKIINKVDRCLDGPCCEIASVRIRLK